MAPGARPIHPLVVRITHWINAFAIACMILSGWRIFDASPLFDFEIPHWATLGGWLGGALAWHFAAMWLLVGNGIVYLAYGFVSGHFGRHFRPLDLKEVRRDLAAALRLRLAHTPGAYNAVQRLAYVTVIALICAAVLSGLAVWKPVQFHALAALMGDYEGARRVHFAAMCGIVGFIVVHLALVALVPKTLLPMIFERAAGPARAVEVLR